MRLEEITAGLIQLLVTCKIRVTRMCKIKSPILVTLLLCPAQVM